MTDRVNRTSAVVRRLEQEANACAAEHAAAVAGFMRRERIGRMERLIDDLQDWIDTRGGRARIEGLGARIEPGRGWFRLLLEGRHLAVRPRDDMTIAVGGVTVRPDEGCPVLDQNVYDEVLARITCWARSGADGPRPWFR